MELERREAYPTDTQHVVNLSGYIWAASWLREIGRLRILDVACGSGYGTDYLATRAGEVVGADIVSSVVAQCRVRYPNPRASFVVMDGIALGLRSETFDAIISQDTIEHVHQDRRFVEELVRVLRPGGILVLFTAQGKERGCRPDNPYHEREYVPNEFQGLLAPYFHSIRWFGRRQGARLKAVERHMERVRRWDVCGIWRIVPRRLRHWMGGLVSRAQGGVALNEITPEDIEYVEGLREDTNLIALCTK